MERRSEGSIPTWWPSVDRPSVDRWPSVGVRCEKDCHLRSLAFAGWEFGWHFFGSSRIDKASATVRSRGAAVLLDQRHPRAGTAAARSVLPTPRSPVTIIDYSVGPRSNRDGSTSKASSSLPGPPVRGSAPALRMYGSGAPASCWIIGAAPT